MIENSRTNYTISKPTLVQNDYLIESRMKEPPDVACRFFLSKFLCTIKLQCQLGGIVLKKLGLTLLIILSALFAAACNGNDDNNAEVNKEGTVSTENENADKQEETHAETETEAETNTEPVSVKAGLGDTLTRFKDEYGDNKGNDAMGIFETDYSLLPMFINGRAVDMNIQFNKDGQSMQTMEKAEQIAANLIPQDAQFQKEYPDKSGTDVQKAVLYHSETIANLFPDYKPAGSFIIIYNHNEGNENEVTGMTIGLGEMK